MAWTLTWDPAVGPGNENSFAEGDNFSILEEFGVTTYNSTKLSLWQRRLVFLTRHVHGAFFVQVRLVLVEIPVSGGGFLCFETERETFK